MYKLLTAIVFSIGGVLSCFDRWIVDGLVNLMPRMVNSYGQRLREWADGYISTYAFFILMGVVLMLSYLLYFVR